MAFLDMDLFCGSKFWDSNLTWFTTDPDFTPCFEKTVLAWIPCLFLWVFSSLEVYYLLNSKYKYVPWCCLNICKFALVLVVLAHCVADFIFAVVNILHHKPVYSVDIYSPAIKFVSFCLAASLLWFNRRRGQRSSGLVFMFWFTCCLCGLAQLRSIVLHALRLQKLPEPTFVSVSYVVYYTACLISFILNFFVEPEPKYSEYPTVERLCPERASSFPSKLTFSWFTPLAWKGYRVPLEAHDLWHMNFEDTAKEIVPRFDKYWDELVAKKSKSFWDNFGAATSKASFLKRSGSVDFMGSSSSSKYRLGQASILMPLCKAFGSTFLFGSFLKLAQDLLTFVSPQLLRLLITFVSTDEPLWKGFVYAALMMATAICQTLLLAQYFYRMSLVGLRIRTALISAIYRKALRISNTARKESTVGEVVNLMAVDAQRFMDLTAYLNMIWSAPLQISLALYFLWQTLGPSVLAGLAVMIVLIPINGWVANKVKTLQIKQMKYKDERVKLMNEILSGIKVLKLYAWEPSFEQQVLKIRAKEMKVLKTAAYLNACTSFIWACAPFLVSLVTFAVYVLIDERNILDAKTAFVSLSLFNILRFPLSMLPFLITNMVQTGVSIKRINKFMNSEELDPNSVQHDHSESDPVVVENGTFSWGTEQEQDTVLRNITLRVKQNSLVAIVGTVGSGKSSLLSAILGEMDKITGRVNTKGSIAYVPQQAWIQNATLKDNILFGKSCEPTNYTKVVRACALQQDFDMLPAADMTEIGEKGINLSGGQKQRVSLARAVYSDSDVYLLDDPLSAVDSHVGKHIFDNVIGPKGLLKRKTRILVTHAITYLPEADLILVLKDGKISESGTYKQLLAQKGAFADFLVQYLQEAGEDENAEVPEEVTQLIESTEGLRQRAARQRSRDSESSSHSLQRQRGSSESNASEAKQIQQHLTTKRPGDKLIEAEKAETGSVKKHVYIYYMKSIGAFLAISTILLNIVFQVFAVGSSIWLSKWSSDSSLVVNGTQDTSKRDMYLAVYAGLGLGQASTTISGTIVGYRGTLRAAGGLYAALMAILLRAPISFFDVTPSGRILTIISNDTQAVDFTLPDKLRFWLRIFFRVIATLAVISYTTPIFVVIILPIAILYFFVQRFYVATSRQLKRLESVSRSPIYSHFGESVTGATSIRAYGVQKRFITESEEKVDFNQVCLYPSLISNRWLAVRLETVGNLIIFFSALFAVLGREDTTAGLVGLSVSYALQITQTLNWLVRMTSDVETNIVAVERIKEYGETPQEAAWEVSPGPPSSWPDKGEVEFQNYQVRYREGLELVLKGISFRVNGGEKVGIVGRTGAGKSSLTLCLFRILEAAGGKIIIDNQDISKLGLHDLRSRLTIIPQDPVLFSGTLRMNLDPFNKEKDEAVWRALELAHLNSFVRGLTSGLQHQVSEGGDNLSVGQRQLVCLGRALLRKTRVLVLDEATAAVDLETDDLIQRTIRTQFKDCTVLTIAHRLNTIMDYDRVLVLDKGLIVEYDSPSNLLKNKSSVFYGMAKDANLV
ncbi:multidrug resistance-associated protein 1 isoform X4 [Macrosteles quadrilineatus]|uniref:multidrug resistance-associated protein 1 isoform X4 n=1 Tax=Macrosteles quadrilineatus TaxID=74068 RepID=UPI0023E175B9|nr:multidrug resistance-associated protein 1 isoform X4 [Macrosteles quadrilineatus]